MLTESQQCVLQAQKRIETIIKDADKHWDKSEDAAWNHLLKLDSNLALAVLDYVVMTCFSKTDLTTKEGQRKFLTSSTRIKVKEALKNIEGIKILIATTKKQK